MPLVDNHQSLNMSGKIISCSVNLVHDVHVAGKARSKKRYVLTIALETDDEAVVTQLTMIRMRQHGPKTADLIVWPA
jgi:hypothetical protein